MKKSTLGIEQRTRGRDSYALVNGNPFALAGNDAIYTVHNAGGELTLFDTATGQGTLTSQYLADRSDYAVPFWREKCEAANDQLIRKAA